LPQPEEMQKEIRRIVELLLTAEAN
jgi:hypothetical protein